MVSLVPVLESVTLVFISNRDHALRIRDGPSWDVLEARGGRGAPLRAAARPSHVTLSARNRAPLLFGFYGICFFLNIFAGDEVRSRGEHAHLSLLNLNVDSLRASLSLPSVTGEVRLVQKPLEGRPSLPRQLLHLRLGCD